MNPIPSSAVPALCGKMTCVSVFQRWKVTFPVPIFPNS